MEWYLRQDHEAIARRYDAIVERVLAWARGRSDAWAIRVTSGEGGQPTPRALISLVPAIADRRDEVLAGLRAEPPRVDLLPAGEDGLYVAPETLVAGEELIVTRRIGDLLDRFAPGRVPRG